MKELSMTKEKNNGFLSVFKGVFGKPEKLDMDYAKQDIVIEDRLELIDDKDKERIETSFKNFQDITGITPALVLVDNSLWNANYTNLENYSYELYLQNFDDEKHWLIVYSEDGNAEEGAWKDWYWEGMQGDDTDSILTASKTDNFTKSLQDALSTMVRGTPVFDLLDDLFFGELLTVNTVRVHGIERIRHADHPGDERDVFALPAFRIALAVVSLVVESCTLVNVRKTLEVA